MRVRALRAVAIARQKDGGRRRLGTREIIVKILSG